MYQIISKDGKVYCVTSVPYPSFIIRSMKEAGYKVKAVEHYEEENYE